MTGADGVYGTTKTKTTRGEGKRQKTKGKGKGKGKDEDEDEGEDERKRQKIKTKTQRQKTRGPEMTRCRDHKTPVNRHHRPHEGVNRNQVKRIGERVHVIPFQLLWLFTVRV